MRPSSIALLQSDPRIARSLAASLCHHFTTVHAARSMDDLRTLLVKYRPEVAVVDVELARLSEVERLHHDFTGTCIVCTHRLADEDMWTAALSAGATDICSSLDTRSIVSAAVHSAPSFAHSAAA